MEEVGRCTMMGWSACGAAVADAALLPAAVAAAAAGTNDRRKEPSFEAAVPLLG
jgi:hypothetical protein